MRFDTDIVRRLQQTNTIYGARAAFIMRGHALLSGGYFRTCELLGKPMGVSVDYITRISSLINNYNDDVILDVAIL